MRKIFFILLMFFQTLSISAQTFDYEKISEHPRLFLKNGEEEKIKSVINETPKLALIHKRIIDESNQMLNEEPVTYIKEGKRLLAVSQEAVKRIFYLSYSYRMTKNKKYSDRAIKEMMKICSFNNWNPTHFLDVGEMVMALAIGYDWLYDNISQEMKKEISNAIIEKGLNAAQNEKDAWFYNAKNNWNSVCNGGLTSGAIAIYEQNPDICKSIIEKCIQTNPKVMECYGPDGGYPEGFIYWSYGTSFQVLLIAALESAFGNDAGLSKAPGFLESARFIEHMVAPSGQSFCFSDTGPGAECNIMMFWFANRLKDLSVLWLENKYLDNPNTEFTTERLLPSLMIFCSKIKMKEINEPSDNFWYNRGDTPVFTYRSGWNSKYDSFLGIKGGSSSTSHAHMDVGSFIYEKNGIRWAMDLGTQDYFTLESKGVNLWGMNQESQRWEVFKICNMAHNTLTINGERHLVKGFAPITQTYRTKQKKGAKIDLTSIFANSVKDVTRCVFLDKKNNLNSSDVILTGDKEVSVKWIMVTPAEARIINDKSIELSKDGKKMILYIKSKRPVKPFILSNEPPHDYDDRNPGTIRIGFEAKLLANSQTDLQVKLISID